MKISKVNHTKVGVSAKPVEKGGMLYDNPGGIKDVDLEKYIQGLNEKAMGLYNIFVPCDNRKYTNAHKTLNLYFKKTVLERLENNDDDDIVNRIISANSDGCSVEDETHRRVAEEIVVGYLRKSLRGSERIVNVFIVVAEAVLSGKDYSMVINTISGEEIGLLVGAIRKDYFKTGQIKRIANSIESKNVPVQIYDDNGEKKLILSSVYIPKKKYIFNFIRNYAGADNEKKAEIMKHMRYLMLVFFYGPDYANENKGQISLWSFGEIIKENQLMFSEKANDILVELCQISKKDKYFYRNKQAEYNKAIKGELVSRYKRANMVEGLSEDDRRWINFISDHTEKVLCKKNVGTDKLHCSYLINNTWNEWVAYIAQKYIEMGKATYNFAMGNIYNVKSGEEICVGKIDDKYLEGISSFDYERIKAKDSFKRSLAEYITFAINNYSNSVVEASKLEKSGNEDILSANDIEYSDNARKNVLRYFGGYSVWNESDLDIVDDNELFDEIEKALSIARNSSFHFVSETLKGGSSDIIDILFSKEYEEVSKIYRKKYYANNVPMFYASSDIINLMNKLYDKPRKLQAQIPSFNKVVSRTYIPQIISDYIKGKNRAKVQSTELSVMYQNALYFVLKEIYYYGFLEENNLGERFLKALSKNEGGNINKDAYDNFIPRYKELAKSGLDFGEICQQIMVDYEQQNKENKKKATAYQSIRKDKKSGKDIITAVKIQDKEGKYKHFRSLLYVGLRQAFMEYLKEDLNKEIFGFLREPSDRRGQFANNEEELFAINWKTHTFDNLNKGIGNDSLITSWYITSHLLEPTQINHLIGQIKNYIQFSKDIEQRAKITENNYNEKISDELDNLFKLLEVLEFVKMFSGQITHELTDYFKDEEEYAEYIAKFVDYGNKHGSSYLQSFCGNKYKGKSLEKQYGIYYDGMNPIINRNIVIASMYGNSDLLEKSLVKIKESEIRDFYRRMDELSYVFKNGSCNNREEQKKVREFQNLKNRIELNDVLTISKLVNDFTSQLISYAYLRERDLMYMQLGYYYVKLNYTDSIEKDSYLNKLNGECRIVGGAILYQIAAMYSYDLPVYIRDENNLAVCKNDNISIGGNISRFYKLYCKDNGEVYEEGLELFENLNNHDEIKEFRNYIDHFKYFAHNDKSIMDMYSFIYDCFFSYDIKLKKSVSYIITNILLSYFINAKLDFKSSGQYKYKDRYDNRKVKTKQGTIIKINENETKTDYMIYKITNASTVSRANEIKVLSEELIEARSEIFIKQVINTLNYKK